MPLIELSGIERRFLLGDTTVHALAGLNLQINAGEYVAVMGPSGSGKSTLLNLLGLLDRPNEGTYKLEGRDVTTLSPDEQATVRSSRIGFVFQSFHLVPQGFWSGKPSRPQAGPAFRRPAPARRHRPRHHHAAGADSR